ncbi:succinylglutamate desuccinylase/aspartoacylase family protein [Methanobacterium oryzae]|uniref:succinylglutamate desuccinylase/aspartoacylase family protein n=1 Tax=Methanobacterium oryzae TaxID=69540 RepID=UPI003D249C5E
MKNERIILFSLIFCFTAIIGIGGVLSSDTVQAAESTVSMNVIVSGTGGDVTNNPYIKNNIPSSDLANQVVEMAKNGTPMVVFGDGSGPKTMIIAGVHGNELSAQIAAMKMIDYLNGKQIKGTVYIVPFVAPSITAQNERNWNGQNLNSVANVAGTPTNQIVNKAKELKIVVLGDFHSTQPGGDPGKYSALCSKAPTYESYNIANYVSKQTGCKLIIYPKAGKKYPGAVEDISNLAGIPAVTCEVVSPHGTVATGSVDNSFNQMIALLKYKGVI